VNLVFLVLKNILRKFNQNFFRCKVGEATGFYIYSSGMD